jgi:hypothetical protein
LRFERGNSIPKYQQPYQRIQSQPFGKQWRDNWSGYGHQKGNQGFYGGVEGDDLIGRAQFYRQNFPEWLRG